MMDAVSDSVITNPTPTTKPSTILTTTLPATSTKGDVLIDANKEHTFISYITGTIATINLV